jgi:hypothetical protein
MRTVGPLRVVLSGAGACWITSMGLIMSHTGSDGLDGSELEDMGRSNTVFE